MANIKEVSIIQKIGSVLASKQIAYIAGATVIGAGSIVGVKASNNAYPGHPLYLVDRAAEKVSLVLTLNHTDKLRKQIENLYERAYELRQISKDNVELLEKQLEEIEEQLVYIHEELRKNWEDLTQEERKDLAEKLRSAAKEIGESLKNIHSSEEEKRRIIVRLKQTANIIRKQGIKKALDKYGFISKKTMEQVKNAPSVASLSDELKQALLHMREEEKLARDVYLALYDKWGDRIFKNIAASEQTHMDIVKELLDKYHLDDPILATGEFKDENLQKLYKELVEKGQKSLKDALEVGATIEDLDIKDLKDYLAEIQDGDIKLAFENLLKGSYNHMRAFYGRLKALGEEYKPQYITPAELKKILENEYSKPGDRSSQQGKRNKGAPSKNEEKENRNSNSTREEKHKPRFPWLRD